MIILIISDLVCFLNTLYLYGEYLCMLSKDVGESTPLGNGYLYLTLLKLTAAIGGSGCVGWREICNTMHYSTTLVWIRMLRYASLEIATQHKFTGFTG
jgi:hypothetical protein